MCLGQNGYHFYGLWITLLLLNWISVGQPTTARKRCFVLEACWKLPQLWMKPTIIWSDDKEEPYFICGSCGWHLPLQSNWKSGTKISFDQIDPLKSTQMVKNCTIWENSNRQQIAFIFNLTNIFISLLGLCCCANCQQIRPTCWDLFKIAHLK